MIGNLIGSVLDLIGGEDGGDLSYQNIPLPVLKELNPDLYQQVVSLNPELEAAITLGPSAMEGISLDPKLRQSQMNALSSLMDISASEGKDARFLADSQRLQNDINQNLRGNTDAIQQNLATRGMSGGPQEMVQRQLAAQQAANRQAQLGLDINAQAQERALQALMNQASLGSQMSQQDFNQQSQVAQAKDAINQFNNQNRQQVQARNIASQNAAQQWNAENAQNVANQNTASQNAAKEYNIGLPQQQYENELAQRQGQLAVDEFNSNKKSSRRNQNLGFFGGAMQSAAQAYAGGKK